MVLWGMGLPVFQPVNSLIPIKKEVYFKFSTQPSFYVDFIIYIRRLLF